MRIATKEYVDKKFDGVQRPDAPARPSQYQIVVREIPLPTGPNGPPSSSHWLTFDKKIISVLNISRFAKGDVFGYDSVQKSTGWKDTSYATLNDLAPNAQQMTMPMYAIIDDHTLLVSKIDIGEVLRIVVLVE